MVKKCLICGQEFQTVLHGETRKYCFECSPSYPKGSNQGRAATVTAIRQAIKRQLVKYKGGKCEICGYDKCIGVLQFHHIDPNEKDFDISKQYNNGQLDMEKFYKEVDKCLLLCANCHGEKHYLEGQEANPVKAPG